MYRCSSHYLSLSPGHGPCSWWQTAGPAFEAQGLAAVEIISHRVLNFPESVTACEELSLFIVPHTSEWSANLTVIHHLSAWKLTHQYNMIKEAVCEPNLACRYLP